MAHICAVLANPMLNIYSMCYVQQYNGSQLTSRISLGALRMAVPAYYILYMCNSGSQLTSITFLGALRMIVLAYYILFLCTSGIQLTSITLHFVVQRQQGFHARVQVTPTVSTQVKYGGCGLRVCIRVCVRVCLSVCAYVCVCVLCI